MFASRRGRFADAGASAERVGDGGLLTLDVATDAGANVSMLKVEGV